MTAAASSEPQQAYSQEQKRKLEHHFAENLDSLTYPLLADIYICEGQISRAKKVCLIGLDRHPRHPAGLYLAATLAVRDGDLGAAEKFLQQALKADEYHVGAAELLVAVQERLKRKKSILEESYRKLLHANPLSRAARERLDHLLAEKKMLEDIRRDLAGLPPEEPETAEEPVPVPPPVLAAEPEPPPAPTPVIPTDPDAVNHSWEDNVKRLAGLMDDTGGEDSGGETITPEPDTATAPPPAPEAPVPAGTALADLEDISEEEPPIAEIDADEFNAPTVVEKTEVESLTGDEKAADEAVPEAAAPEAEVTKQVAKEEIFEPGVATAASPHIEHEQELIETPDQRPKESDFASEDTILVEPDELTIPDTDQIDEGEPTAIPAVEPERADDSSLLTEAERVKAEEAELAQPDMAAFREPVTDEPQRLEEDLADREIADAGDPVTAAEKQDQIDQPIELIDEADDLLAEEEGEILTDVSPAMVEESAEPESPGEAESFEPGKAAERDAAQPSVEDLGESPDESSRPEGIDLQADTAQEQELLEDYAEPAGLATGQDFKDSPEAAVDSITEQAAVSSAMVDDDGAAYWAEALDSEGKSFEPQRASEAPDQIDDEFTAEEPPVLSPDDGLPKRLPETDTEGDAELTAEPKLTGQSELAEDSTDEPIPAASPQEDDGAAYWGEAYDIEEETFGPQRTSEAPDQIDDEFTAEEPPVLSPDDGLPKRLPETDTEGDAELTAEPKLTGQSELAEDSTDEPIPAASPQEDDGAAYWGEAYDIEEETFEPQTASEALEEVDDDFNEGSTLDRPAPEGTDEFDPSSASAESAPDVAEADQDAAETIEVEAEGIGAEETGFAKPDLAELEIDAETDKTELDEEEARFEPVSATPEDESFLDTDKEETGSPAKLDQEEYPKDRESLQGGDGEAFLHDDEEIESGETVIPVTEDEMQTREQEEAEDVADQEDSFEPLSATAEDEAPDADQFVRAEDSIPSTAHDEPYRPDMQSLMQDMRDVHLEEEDATAEAESEPSVAAEPDSGMDSGEQLSSEDVRRSLEEEEPDEAESFEPGPTTPAETIPTEPEETAPSVAAGMESDDAVSFEPGEKEPASMPETEVVGKEQDASDQQPADEGELPEADAAHLTPVQPITSPEEDTEKPKDQFEPGEMASEDTAPVSEEHTLPDSRETSRAPDKQAWEAEAIIDTASSEGDDQPESAMLEEEEPLPQAEAPPAGTEEDEYLEKELVSTQELEDQDSASRTFTPGELSAEDDTSLAAPDSPATEKETENIPVSDLSVVDTSGEDDLEVLEKMAYDSRDMQGESFEPSTEIPAHEDTAPESATEAELALEEDKTAEEELDEDSAVSTERKWLDPKMATFTLATIYKVQGLYQQALQVLDLLEEKGADPDRIAAERDAILRQIGAPPSE